MVYSHINLSFLFLSESFFSTSKNKSLWRQYVPTSLWRHWLSLSYKNNRTYPWTLCKQTKQRFQISAGTAFKPTSSRCQSSLSLVTWTSRRTWIRWTAETARWWLLLRFSIAAASRSSLSWSSRSRPRPPFVSSPAWRTSSPAAPGPPTWSSVLSQSFWIFCPSWGPFVLQGLSSLFSSAPRCIASHQSGIVTVFPRSWKSFLMSSARTSPASSWCQASLPQISSPMESISLPTQVRF